ncbi:MAG: hypothetical protein OXU63_11375 [Acidobacteriota bacterium]|nr:hypothetical protein [Acidobacteriota bacterium]
MIPPRLEVVLEDIEQDQVEDPLPLPEIVLGQRNEGAQQSLEGDEQTAGDAAMAANRKRDVPLPEVAPVAEITRGLFSQEVADFR